MRCYQAMTAMLILVLAAPAAAEIYRWTDSQGRVHYGDRPGRADAQAVPLPTPSSGLGVNPDEAAAQERLLRTREDERAAEQAARTKAAAERERRRRNCAIARDRYRRVRSAVYVYEPQVDGSRRVYGDDERCAAEARAEAAKRHWCGS